MAAVHVTVKNTSGQTVAFSMDDETDADRIEHFRKMTRREELAAVDVKPAKAEPKAPAKTPAAK